MAQFFNFGSGSDGVWTPGTTTHAPTDASCSGTSGSHTLSATNASFASGQIILIHQTRGTGAGQWEVNQIGSYSTGTITTVHPLSYTYTDSGASQAQVIVMPQYSGVNITGTLTAKAWNGNVGGIIPILCSGRTTVSGTITASAKGYMGARGGQGSADGGSDGAPAKQGEGTVGAGGIAGRDDPLNHHLANGNGGGAGDYKSDTRDRNGGGGGGNGSSGANGGKFSSAGERGQGGGVAGNNTLTNMVFGGAGGGGGGDRLNNPSVDNSSRGGHGGGIILIFSKEIVVSGNLISNGGAGENGRNPSGSQGTGAAGGGGAGGSILLKAVKASIGTNKVLATGGAGGDGAGGANGGAGGTGRIRIEACSLSGSTNPTASSSIGGKSYCGGGIIMF